MSKFEKFAFAPIIEGQIDQNAIKRKKIWTEADVNNARQEGYMEGENSAMAMAQKSASDSLRTISNLMQMLIGRLHNEAQELNEDAVLVALSAAKSLAGVAIDQFEKSAIENYFKDVLANLRNMPRICININDESRDLIAPSLMKLAQDIGYEGQIEIRGDSSQAKGDCTIEWQGGAIRHNQKQALENIEKAAQTWLTSKNEMPIQFDLFDHE